MAIAPLKLDGSDGDLKEMTTSEENYLAYRAGLNMAAIAQTAAGAITTSSSSSSNIGSYSNTFYNQAVGTHPGSSLSTGTTTTTLYQKTAAESETSLVRPVKFTTSGTRVDEAGNTDLNTLCDRLVSTIMANEYPGTYRLGSSSPGAAWDTHLSSVFTDTRTDGTSVAYNIYQRQTYTAPTAVRPIKLNGSNGDLKEMTDAEISTLGIRIRNNIAGTANSVGFYQLRSSSQGAPTAAGTWVARGTATDTRNTTADVNYSATYSATYSGNYVGNYLGNYTRTSTRNSTVAYTRTSTRNSTVAYTRTRVTTYTRTSTVNYTNPNAINYINLSGPMTVAFCVSTLCYYGRFTGNYLGPGPAYTGNFVGNFVGNFLGNYAGDFIGNFVGNYAGDFIGNYTGNYQGAYAGDYVGNYQGNYVGNYAGLTIQSGSGTIETYTLYCRTA